MAGVLRGGVFGEALVELDLKMDGKNINWGIEDIQTGEMYVYSSEFGRNVPAKANGSMQWVVGMGWVDHKDLEGPDWTVETVLHCVPFYCLGESNKFVR